MITFNIAHFVECKIAKHYLVLILTSIKSISIKNTWKKLVINKKKVSRRQFIRIFLKKPFYLIPI